MCGITEAMAVISAIATVGQAVSGHEQAKVEYADTQQANTLKEEIASENLTDTYDQNFTKRVRHIEDTADAKQDVEYKTRATASTIYAKQGERGAYSERLQRQPYVDQAFQNFYLDRSLSRDLEDYEYSQSQAGRDYQSTVLGFERAYKPSSGDLALQVVGAGAEAGAKIYDAQQKKNKPKKGKG